LVSRKNSNKSKSNFGSRDRQDNEEIRIGGLMGEYECCDCLQTFWCDEPPEGREVCDECKEEERKERQRRE
jgi:hypothetical protein